jgi:hypothetical protein
VITDNALRFPGTSEVRSTMSELAHILIENFPALYVPLTALSPKHLKECSSAELRKMGGGFGPSMFG